jgi:large subunit ribosomal protein L17
MASHRRLVRHFGRKFKARKALLRGLMKSLVEHGRIKTTLIKAKETRRQIEKAITLGKRGNLNSTRVLSARLADADSAVKLVKDIAVRFKDCNNGYTRIVKIGVRPGDKAEMAFLEFVDFDWKAKEAAKGKTEATGKSAKKAGKTELASAKVESKKKKELFIAKDKYKKHVRKIKNDSRAASNAR